jgi:hypothetical protein
MPACTVRSAVTYTRNRSDAAWSVVNAPNHSCMPLILHSSASDLSTCRCIVTNFFQSALPAIQSCHHVRAMAPYSPTVCSIVRISRNVSVFWREGLRSLRSSVSWKREKEKSMQGSTVSTVPIDQPIWNPVLGTSLVGGHGPVHTGPLPSRRVWCRQQHDRHEIIIILFRVEHLPTPYRFRSIKRHWAWQAGGFGWTDWPRTAYGVLRTGPTGVLSTCCFVWPSTWKPGPDTRIVSTDAGENQGPIRTWAGGLVTGRRTNPLLRWPETGLGLFSVVEGVA